RTPMLPLTLEYGGENDETSQLSLEHRRRACRPVGWFAHPARKGRPERFRGRVRDHEDGGGVAPGFESASICGAAGGRHRARLQQPAQRRKTCWHIPLRWL